MNYSLTELYISIIIIGGLTFLIRAVFLFRLPDMAHHPIIRRGMDAVPASMLVALVVPFTFFLNNQFSFMRAEVFAIILVVPVVLLTKKYSYGLIVAIVAYILLNLLFF